MSDDPVPLMGPFDGICFLGGGVRCATTQYAGMAVIMNLLKLTPQEMLAGTKYMSGNSGASFTISSLLCYPLFVDSSTKASVFPLDTIKDITNVPSAPTSSPTPATSDLHGFYQKYWTDPLKTIVTSQYNDKQFQTFFKMFYTWLSSKSSGKLPFSTSQLEFMAYSYADIGLFTWPNGVGMLAMAPFAQYLVGQKFKDMPLAVSANLVVSLGATVVKDSSNNANSYFRVTAPTESTFGGVAASASAAAAAITVPKACPKAYTTSVSYSWDKSYSDYTYYGQYPETDGSMVGMPFNMFYGFGNNKPANQLSTPYLVNPGQSASSTPTLGNITYTPSSSEDGDPVVVPIPALSVASSKIGESQVLALVSASSSYTGCSLQYNNTPVSSECLTNFLNYDQAVQVDMATGQLFLNSADQKASFNATTSKTSKTGSLWDASFGTSGSSNLFASKLKKALRNQASTMPMAPWKDSGVYSKDRVLMNLCDGTNSYDNTGIIPMINAMQVYETASDLATKTYNILYFDGPDSSDQGYKWPSNNHFAKLFGGSSDPQNDFGLNIFDGDVAAITAKWQSTQFPDPTTDPGAQGNFVWLDVYYYQGLKTKSNDFCNVPDGINLNILVLAPHSQLNTLYEVPANNDENGLEGVDYHAKVNAILVECFLDLERRYKLFSNTYGAYVCDPSSNTCSVPQTWPSGASPQSLAACMQSCGVPYKCDPNKGCVQDSSGAFKSMSDCKQSCQQWNCDLSDPLNPSCKAVTSGSYSLQDDCTKSCKEPPKYKCTNDMCTASIDPDAVSLDECQASCTKPGPKPSFGSTGGLAAWQIALIVIACVIVIIGIALLVWRIKKAKKQSKMKRLQQQQPTSPYKLDSSKKTRSKRKHS